MSNPAGDGPGSGGRIAAAADQLRLTQSQAVDNLANALSRAGFRRCIDALPDGNSSGWRGILTFTANPDDQPANRMTVVDIVVPDAYPFCPPKVHPGNQLWAQGAVGRAFGEQYYEPKRGWHRDADLALCLFDDADATLLPWADVAAVLEQATAWLAADAGGWAGDAPTLDLERYLPPADEHRVLLYGPLAGVDGVVLRCRPKHNGVLTVSGTAVPRKSGSRSGKSRWEPDAILVSSAGELDRPIRDWVDLLEAVGPDRAQVLERAHRDGLQRVLLTYARRGVSAALALQLVPGPDRAVRLRALTSAPDDRATRDLRAGVTAAALSKRKVAIVGVGAVGSVVADLLHRCGTGELHLVDFDRVLPGNTTRHLVGQSAVGKFKAHAVAEHLLTARPDRSTVTSEISRLTDASQAVALLAAHDVVVDATADSTATALLIAAANAGAGQLLSVAVLADGYAARVDRTPRFEGQPPLPHPQLPAAGATVYEAGCGSPVSTTPPTAVWEAAAMAARHTIGLLTTADIGPAGEERFLHLDVEMR